MGGELRLGVEISMLKRKTLGLLYITTGFITLGASMAWIIFTSIGIHFVSWLLKSIGRYSSGIHKPEDLYMVANILLPILILIILGAIVILIGFKLQNKDSLPRLPGFWLILLLLLICLQLWRAVSFLKLDSLANAVLLFLILAFIFFHARYRESGLLNSSTKDDKAKHRIFHALLITAAILLLISFLLSVYFEHRFPGFIIEFS